MRKIHFQDLPNRTTPLSATILNLEQDYIEEAINSVDDLKLEKTITVSDPSTKNLNDYTTEGRYYFGSAPTNIPAGVDGFLEVMVADNGTVKQIWYRHGTINTNDYETYVRTYSNGWSSWKRYQMIQEPRQNTTVPSGGVAVNVDKIGKIVAISIFQSASISMTSGTAVSLGTLPSEYRPVRNTATNIIIKDNNWTPVEANLVIRNTGAIEITQFSGRNFTTTQILGSMTYIID